MMGLAKPRLRESKPHDKVPYISATLRSFDRPAEIWRGGTSAADTGNSTELEILKVRE